MSVAAVGVAMKITLHKVVTRKTQLQPVAVQTMAPTILLATLMMKKITASAATAAQVMAPTTPLAILMMTKIMGDAATAAPKNDGNGS